MRIVFPAGWTRDCSDCLLRNKCGYVETPEFQRFGCSNKRFYVEETP